MDRAVYESWFRKEMVPLSKFGEEVFLQVQTLSSKGNRYYLNTTTGKLEDCRPDLSEDITQMWEEWVCQSHPELW